MVDSASGMLRRFSTTNRKPRVRKAKVRELVRLCSRFAVLIIAETHGKEAEVLKELSLICRSHVPFIVPSLGCGSRERGGMLALVSKAVAGQSLDDPIVP